MFKFSPALSVLAMAFMLFAQHVINSSQGLARSNLSFKEFDPSLENYGAVNWDARWDRPNISVCWINGAEYVQQKKWVQLAVERTWERHSSVRFSGWATCDGSGADIEILVDESGPRSRVGMHSTRASPSMWLNFTFNSWGESCKNRQMDCIVSIAVHEFGHALGFEHEQLQADAPKECVEQIKKQGQWETRDEPPKALTSYDKDSVMNYCNAIWNNRGALSENDKKAIAILFPLD